MASNDLSGSNCKIHNFEIAHVKVHGYEMYNLNKKWLIVIWLLVVNNGHSP